MDVKFRNLLFDKSILLWGAWAWYTAISWFVIGQNDTGLSIITFLWVFIFMSYYSMIVAAYEIMHNPKRTSLLVMIFLIVFQVIGTYSELRAGSYNEENRVFIVGNQLSLSGNVLVFIACFRNFNKWLRGRSLVVIVTLAAVSIFLIATRKAFIGLLIIIMFWLVAKYNLLKSKQLPIFIVLFILLYHGMFFVLGHTFLGARFQALEKESSIYNTTNIWWLNFLGDRAFFYIQGWLLFLKHPFVGIGLRNFRYITDSSYIIHSEYMVQLCECGLIGFTMFVMFYVSLFKRTVRIKRISKLNYYSLLSWLVYVLFISLTAWTYQSSDYFICFGFIIGVTNLFVKYEQEHSDG